ncbi:FMN-binding negative transcriptional regulator [Sphingomonas silueang]|uniref:FMN-binding negative transcriptional regulator n=1 Tax=Sphingomonas silueang TaxID=3156617 RepID=UPI0032B5504F
MHPDAAFRMDEGAARAFVAGEGFGVLFAQTPEGPRAAQLPVVVDADGSLRFHLARGNALTPYLAGATALFVAQGPHAYVSPRWYGAGPDEVPTWNYLSVEVEGVVRPLDRAGLRGQIDALAATYEDEPWAIDSIDPARAEAMLGAIAGFALVPTAWRGTAKLSQNKPVDVRERVTARLGSHPLAAWMRAAMLGGALLLGACDPLEDTDWLLGAARSPEGTRIARLWCPDLCDVPGSTVVTVSPAGRAVPVERDENGFPPQGALPEEDVVLRFDAGGFEGAPIAARWTAPDELTVTAPCPAARDAVAGGVRIRLRATDCKAPA